MENGGTVYEAVNEAVLSIVPSSALRILDIGCGSGALGERLRSVGDRHVTGITYSRQEAQLASRRLSRVICEDLNGFDFSPLGQFDCVIASHILEHLHSPHDLLERVKCALGPESLVLVALPNVLFWRQRREFLRGRWQYRDGGILDRTHFRFFDRQSSEELLLESGYEILTRIYDGAFPLTGLIRKYIGSFAKRIDRKASCYAPGLFAFQFVYLARRQR